MNDLVLQQNVLGDFGALDKIERFANLMATAKVTIPPELQNSPGDCLALALQAQAWGMNPFTVAQKAHVIKGKIGYEAQLVNAVITRHAPITGRPQFHYSDGWERVLGKFKTTQGNKGPYNAPGWAPKDEEGLWCEVSATMKGEDEPRVLRMMMVQAQPRQSTMWATDPKQQLSYACMKKWARLHCPDVLLGIYTPEEIETQIPDEKDITPTADLKARLNQQGESLTVRAATDSPPAKPVSDPPQGEELTGTETTEQRTQTESTQDIKLQDAAAKVRQILRDQKQVPIAEPNDQDKATLAMAVDSLRSCRTLEELKQCGDDLDGVIHPDLKGQARAVYKEIAAGVVKKAGLGWPAECHG